MEFNHKPVLLKECIEGLNIKEDGVYVDGTLGGAGHSKEILKRLSDKGTLIGIDRDIDALNAAKINLAEFNNVKYVHGNHDDIKTILNDLDIEKVDGILLDLGVSSYQLDERERGFSYLGENRLDMRMDKSQELTAEKVVNEYPEDKLLRIIYEYGEERYAPSIAKKIVIERQKKPITSTLELVDIIKKAVPASYLRLGHPAKQTFQAIRIEVNHELEILKKSLETGLTMLNSGGRMVVISFHSLEDKIVKKLYSRRL